MWSIPPPNSLFLRQVFYENRSISLIDQARLKFSQIHLPLQGLIVYVGLGDPNPPLPASG